jgi:Berberine and berberine like
MSRHIRTTGHRNFAVSLKNRYDPTNLFRLNANVLPAANR